MDLRGIGNELEFNRLRVGSRDGLIVIMTDKP